jgi:NAD(P)-dependent dehydrogenase (short-subunit alcohol dehydrogenase family)
VREALSRMPGAVHVTHDVSNVDGVPEALDAVETGIGPVTTLVSNAGVPAMSRGDLLDMTTESFDRCIDVNLRGAFFLIQEVARRMLGSAPDAYRSIHVVTSVSAEIVSADRAEYCISKAGASMMTKALSQRAWHPRGSASSSFDPASSARR